MNHDDFATYPGTVTPTLHDRVPALAFDPGANGYARFASRTMFVPPVVVAGWFQVRDSYGSEQSLDGLHLHLGHVGNGRNYVASLVRRDGHAKIAAEYGWAGYSSLHYTDGGPAFVDLRVYLFEVVWERNRIRTWVGSEAGGHTMDAKLAEDVLIPAGSVGLRSDHLRVVGNLTVREIARPTEAP